MNDFSKLTDDELIEEIRKEIFEIRIAIGGMRIRQEAIQNYLGNREATEN